MADGEAIFLSLKRSGCIEDLSSRMHALFCEQEEFKSYSYAANGQSVWCTPRVTLEIDTVHSISSFKDSCCRNRETLSNGIFDLYILSSVDGYSASQLLYLSASKMVCLDKVYR